MHVGKQDIECDAEIVQEFLLCRKYFGDYREIEKEIQYLEKKPDNVENQDFVSYMFSFGNASYCKVYARRD